MAAAAPLKVPLTLIPSVVIAAIDTTIMRATITAYSTAVGPSSLLNNLTNFSCKVRMRKLLKEVKLKGRLKVNHKIILDDP